MNSESKADAPKFEHDAFISYRRSDGTRAARWLRRVLLSYRLPKTLQTNPPKKLEVYLDTVYEKATEDFFENNIKPALEASRYLIVIASPDAQNSRADGSPNWVEREIDVFQRTPQRLNVMVARTTGDLEGPMPSNLRQLFPNIEIVSLRNLSLLRFLIWPRLWRLRDESLKIVAPLFEVAAKDMPVIRQEERNRRLKTTWLVSVFSLLLVAVMATLAAWAYLEYRAAEKSRRNAESRAYSAQALRAAETDPAEALRLAINAGELGENPDSEAALRSAIRVSHLEAVLFHNDGTTDADFASSQVVTVGNDGLMRYWSATTGRPSQAIRVFASGKRAHGIAVSSDAKWAAVRGDSNKVVVWDVASKRELHRFDTFDGIVHVGFSPDGAEVIAVHGASVTRRRTKDGGGLQGVGGTVLRHATINPDGTLLAAASHDGHRVQLYDKTGRMVRILETGGSTRLVAFSADGKWLAAVSDGNAPGFKIWNIADPKNAVEYDRLRLDVTDVHVECALFFPSSLHLVMGSSDGVVRIWKEEHGEWKLVNSLRGHTGPVSDVTVSRAENIVASAGAGTDRTVRVWIQKPGGLFSSESWTALSVARGHRGPVTKVRLSDDGRRMVTVGREEGRAMLWNTDPNHEAATVGPLFRKVNQVVLNANGSRVALLAEHAPYLYSVIDHKLSEIGSREMFGMASYNRVDLSPDGNSLLVAGPEDETAIYDVATGKQRIALHGHAGRVASAKYDRSGKRIVTAGDDDKTLRVWDEAGIPLASMPTGAKAVDKAILSSDGRYVVSTGSDQPARVWSTDGHFVVALGQAESHDACFSADGTALWTMRYHTARVWRTKDWQLHDEVSSYFGVPSLGRLLGEDYVLFGDQEGSVELVAPNKRRTTLRHKRKVTAAALSPDHSRLVTGDVLGDVVVWDTNTGQVASNIGDHTDEVTDIAFSGDGRFFATASNDGTARLYALRVSDLVTLARSRLPMNSDP
jgi:WD40 repeat protein